MFTLIIIIIKMVPKTITTENYQISNRFSILGYKYIFENDNYYVNFDYNQLNIQIIDDNIQDVYVFGLSKFQLIKDTLIF